MKPRPRVLPVGDIDPLAVETLLAGPLPAPAGATADPSSLWVIVLRDLEDAVRQAPPGGAGQNLVLLDWLAQLAQAESCSRSGPRVFLRLPAPSALPRAAPSSCDSLLAAAREVEQLAQGGAAGLAERLEQIAESLRLGATLEEPSTAPRTWRDPGASPAVKLAGLAAKLRAAPAARVRRAKHSGDLQQRLVSHLRRLESELEVHRGSRSRAAARLEATLASTSWRVTAPLRALGRALGRGGKPLDGPECARPGAGGCLALDAGWSARLERHAPTGTDLERERDRAVDRRALIVDTVTPTPDRDSGSADAMGLLRALLRLGFRCSFFATSEPAWAPGDSQDLMREGVAVLAPSGTPSLTDHLIAEGSSYDLVVFRRVGAALATLDAVLALCPRARVVFNPVDRHQERVAQRAELEGSEDQGGLAEELREAELEVCRRTHATFVPSPVERRFVEEEVPGAKVRILPCIREAPGRTADFDARHLGVLLHELGVPATLPGNAPFEIDLRCEDLDSWRAWRAGHQELFDAGFLLRVASTIANRGLVDPWSGRQIPPREIRLDDENFRESLAAAGFFSRTRAVILEWQALAERDPTFRDSNLRIFCPEAVTSFAAALRARHPIFIGTEYAPSEEEARRIAPYRHEDLLELSFPEASFDLAITNDVLEHVADLDRALAELHRVLAPGGALITTVPFRCDDAEGQRRALLRGGELVFLRPPEYHGNPISEKGSLVFEIPGWDLLDRARAAGFVDVAMHFRASATHGVLGREIPGVFVLGARRAASSPAQEQARSLIGIAGLPRSGTTLLTAVLDAHSRCEALYEPWNGAPDRLGYQRFDRESLLRQVGLTLPASATLVVKETSTRIEYLDCIEHLLSAVSNPQDRLFCWIVRNPWHVYFSSVQARRAWWGEEGLEVNLTSLDRWLQGAAAGLRRLTVLARRMPAVVVCYERLVERPASVIAALMAETGLPFEAGQLHYEERIDRLKVRGDVDLWRAPAPIAATARDLRTKELAAWRTELLGTSQLLLDRLEEAAAPLGERDLARSDDPLFARFLAAVETLVAER